MGHHLKNILPRDPAPGSLNYTHLIAFYSRFQTQYLTLLYHVPKKSYAKFSPIDMVEILPIQNFDWSISRYIDFWGLPQGLSSPNSLSISPSVLPVIFMAYLDEIGLEDVFRASKAVKLA